ncbi:MAG: TetR/AcrR family transcriptional regulator [bacterium]|nr:TetR/AcrR family transcriptional regulator [bacterium]
MARPREFDIDKAIEDISDQFWAEGFESSGITDIEKVTGVARASLYGAFGSKMEMLHQAIDFYLDNRVEVIIGPVDGTGLDGVVDFFRRFAGIVKARPERAAMGCLMVNSTVELGTSDPGVNERAVRYRNRIRGAFRSALEQAYADGEIDGRVKEHADLAYIMLMGLYVTVKGGASPDEVQNLCNLAIDTTESWRVTTPEAVVN